MSNVVFELLDGHRLVFTSESWSMLLSHRQTEANAHEAGGTLLGRHLLESPNLVVDEITTPQVQDRRSRHGFYRSAQHQRIAYSRWENSSGTCAYLGLWHTHPEAVPSPSRVDTADWRKALRGDTYEGNSLFFVIVGTHEIRIWEGQQQRFFRHSFNLLKRL